MPSQQTTARSVSILLDMIEAETEQLRSLLPHASPSMREVVNETLRIHQGNFDLSKIESVQLDEKLRTHWTIWASNHVEQLRALKDTILKEHTNNPIKPDTKLVSEEEEMEKDVWKIRKEVQDGIDSVREDAYKLQALRVSPWLKKKKEKKNGQTRDQNSDSTELKSQNPASTVSKSQRIVDNAHDLEERALAEEQNARNDYGKTVEIANPTPKKLLETIGNAGALLGTTEHLMLAYDRLRNESPKPKADVILPAAMTVVKTARQQLNSARSVSQNLKSQLGAWEIRVVLEWALLPSVFAYLFFHPSLPVTQFIFQGSQAAAFLYAIRPYWEIISWSLFGAISMSVITIAQDYAKDEFDPRHIEKYKFRIPIAPFVTTAIIFFLSVVLFEIASSGTGGGGKVTVDLTNPNIPLLIMLSFILGFFGKKSLDLLSDIWTRLFESIDSKTSSTSGKKTSDSGS